MPTLCHLKPGAGAPKGGELTLRLPIDDVPVEGLEFKLAIKPI